MTKNKIKKTASVNTNAVSPKNGSINHYYWFYLFLFFAALLLYGWTVNFNWGLDDVPFIYNPIKKIENNWEGISTLLGQKYGRYDYRPVTLTSFWIENKLFSGLFPGKSHFINAIIYGFLVVQIFRFIVIAEFFDDKQKLTALALLTSFLFLIHPVHVSVVANVKSRDNLLSMLWGITSSIQCFYFFKDKKWWRIPLILFLIVFALLSKRDAYSFFLIPMVYFIIYKSDVIILKKKSLIYIVLLILLPVASEILVDFFKDTFTTTTQLSMNYIDSPLVNDDTFINRIALSLTTLLYYLKFMLIPHGYYFYFGYNQIPLSSLWSPFNILSFVLYFGIFTLVLKYYKKEKIYLFSFLFFMLSIAYASNLLVIVSGILMDRYSFIASLGFILGISALIINVSDTKNWRIVYSIKLLPLYVVLILATVYRTSAWKDMYSLFNRDLPSLTHSAQAQAIAGGVYINSGLFESISPEEKDEKIKKGESYVDNALKVNDKNKFALESKGICRTYFKDDLNAKYFLKNAIAADSNYTGPYNNLGIAHRNLGEIDSALIYFGIAMEKEELFSYPANNFVQMLVLQKRYNSVDSTLNVLQNRFPKNTDLSDKIYNWKFNRQWTQF